MSVSTKLDDGMKPVLRSYSLQVSLYIIVAAFHQLLA